MIFINATPLARLMKASRFVNASKTTYTPVRLRKQITKFCRNWRSR